MENVNIEQKFYNSRLHAIMSQGFHWTREPLEEMSRIIKDTFIFSFIFFCGKTSEQSATDNMNAGVVRNGSKSVAKNRTSTKMKVTLKIEEQEEMKPIKNNPELKEV